MIQTQARVLPLFPAHPEELRDASSVLLVEAPGAIRFLDATPGKQSVIHTQMRMISTQMLSQVQPDAVVAPLICAQWDILDLGQILQDMGYCGTLFVLTKPLPRAELVLREVRAFCPDIEIRLIETL